VIGLGQDPGLGGWSRNGSGLEPSSPSSPGATGATGAWGPSSRSSPGSPTRRGSSPSSLRKLDVHLHLGDAFHPFHGRPGLLHQGTRILRLETERESDFSIGTDFQLLHVPAGDHVLSRVGMNHLRQGRQDGLFQLILTHSYTFRNTSGPCRQGPGNPVAAVLFNTNGAPGQEGAASGEHQT